MKNRAERPKLTPRPPPTLLSLNCIFIFFFACLSFSWELFLSRLFPKLQENALYIYNNRGNNERKTQNNTIYLLLNLITILSLFTILNLLTILILFTMLNLFRRNDEVKLGKDQDEEKDEGKGEERRMIKIKKGVGRRNEGPLPPPSSQGDYSLVQCVKASMSPICKLNIVQKSLCVNDTG